jgi:hypothetical protein
MAPVFVVSGWMRSGTSMLMRALEAGGMDAAYRGSRDEMADRAADEHWHPQHGHGLYELERADYSTPGFPRGYEGRLVKCLRGSPARMSWMLGGIRVVYMLRDFEEIRQSYGAFFPASIPPSVEWLARETDANLTAIGGRDHVDLMTLRYEAVLADPVAELGRVGAFVGVPLDVGAAARVVDPALRRFRAVELVPGIV